MNILRIYAVAVLSLTLIFPNVYGQAKAQLDINDVRLLVYSNGVIGQGSTDTLGCEVPAGTGLSPMFSSGLWMGGVGDLGQIHFAAHVRDEPGRSDFFPGPLSAGTTATITPDVSAQYDHVWKVSKAEVLLHRSYYDCLADPGCDVSQQFPNGYSIPPSFLSWPAMGDPNIGQAVYLAPFMDLDQDGTYDPAAGDHPCLLGDQALYAIFNDVLDVHTISGGVPVGMEVHIMVFAYNTVPGLEQTVFVQYLLYNRANAGIEEFHVSNFADFELGCGDDDVIGTDVARGMVYVLNGDEMDEDCGNDAGYGTQPPAFGMVVLKGMRMDLDTLDNTTVPAISALNGHGFNDGIIDNERHGLSNSIYFLRQGDDAMSEPTNPPEFMNYMLGRWKDGTPLSHGGDGYGSTTASPNAAFAYPGDSDPTGVGTGGMPSGTWGATLDMTGTAIDPQVLGGLGSSNLGGCYLIDLLVAYVFAPSSTGTKASDLENLQQSVDNVRAFASQIPFMFDSHANDGSCGEMIALAINGPGAEQPTVVFYPNPVADRFTLVLGGHLGPSQLTILDMRGTVAFQQRLSGGRSEIAVDDLAPGVYVLKVEGRGTATVSRFIKE